MWNVVSRHCSCFFHVTYSFHSSSFLLSYITWYNFHVVSAINVSDKFTYLKEPKVNPRILQIKQIKTTVYQLHCINIKLQHGPISVIQPCLWLFGDDVLLYHYYEVSNILNDSVPRHIDQGNFINSPNWNMSRCPWYVYEQLFPSQFSINSNIQLLNSLSR